MCTSGPLADVPAGAKASGGDPAWVTPDYAASVIKTGVIGGAADELTPLEQRGRRAMWRRAAKDTDPPTATARTVAG